MPIYPARHWTRLNAKYIQCDVCPNFCKLKEGKRGRCYVRGNEAGRMALYTDGKTSGVCVDPIEKKPLNHFLPGTRVLSFGTIGCNLSCKFCQNWHISHSKEDDKLYQEVTPESLVKAAKRHKCESIAFTYNDPVIFMEFALQVAKQAREENIKTVAVTAGFMTKDAGREFAQGIDGFNVDLKAFTQGFYSKVCNAKLQPVLDTLLLIKEEGKWVEITTLLIPGENDSPEEIRGLSRWVASNLGKDTPVHFTAFHPDGVMLTTPRTPPSTLISAVSIARSEGLLYVYTGNVHSPLTQSTFCPSCNTCLISRDWHDTHINPEVVFPERNHGHMGCPSCGDTIPGVFSKRQYNDATIDRPFRVIL